MPAIIGIIVAIGVIYLYYLLIQWMFVSLAPVFFVIVAVLGTFIAPVIYAYKVHSIFLTRSKRWQAWLAGLPVFALILLMSFNFVTIPIMLLRNIPFTQGFAEFFARLNQFDFSLFEVPIRGLEGVFNTSFPSAAITFFSLVIKAILLVALLLFGRGMENEKKDEEGRKGYQPAYLQYFFKEAFADMSRLASETSSLIATVFEKCGKGVYVASYGPQIILIWPLTITVGLALLVPALISILVVLTLLLFHSIGLIFVLGVSYFLALTFFLLERSLILLRSGYAKCPHSACHEALPLPEYACPACGKWHDHLLPGRYGVFTRRCECGDGYLPTVFFLGKHKLESRCPACKNELPAQLFGANLHIPIYGGSSSGKTMFMMAAIWEMLEKKPQEMALSFINEKDEERYNRAWKPDFEQGVCQQKTNERLPSAFLVSLKRPFGLACSLYVYDPAGEAMSSEDDLLQHKFLRFIDGALLLIDPLTLPSIRQRIERDHVDTHDSSPSPDDPNEILEHVTNAMEKQGLLSRDRAFKKKIAVVFTKCDVPVIKAGLGHGPLVEPVGKKWDSVGIDYSVHLAEWLNRQEPELSLRLKTRFGQLRFFAASALGHEATTNSAFQPKGVLAPIFWLMASRSLLTHPFRHRALLKTAEVLVSALVLSPLFLVALSAYGFYFMSVENARRAEQDAAFAASNTPTAMRAFFNDERLGEKARTKFVTLALETGSDCNEAIELGKSIGYPFPAERNMAHVTALCLVKQGDKASAETQLQDAFTQYAKAKNEKSMAEVFEMGTNVFDGSRKAKWLENFADLANNVDQVGHYIYAGSLYLAAGGLAEAEAVYKKAIKMNAKRVLADPDFKKFLLTRNSHKTIGD